MKPATNGPRCRATIALLLLLLALPRLRAEDKPWIGLLLNVQEPENKLIVLDVVDPRLSGTNGIQPFDFVLEMNGEPIRAVAQALALVEKTGANQVIRLKIERNAQEMEIDVRSILPTPCQAKLAAGIALSQKGDWSGALASLGEAAALDPHDHVVRKHMGNCLGVLKDYGQAKTNLLYAAKRDPLDATISFWLGQIYRIEGSYQAAEQEFRKILNHPSKVARRKGYSALGFLLAARKRPQEAVDSLLAAVNLHREQVADYQKLYAILLYDLKDPTNALPVIREVIRLAPQDHAAYYNMGYAYWQMGCLAKALQWWDYLNQQSFCAPDERKEFAGLLPPLRQLMKEFALEITEAAVNPRSVAPGDRVELRLDYRMDALSEEVGMAVTETRSILAGDQELARETRTEVRPGGAYSTLKSMAIPREAAPGMYKYRAAIQVEIAPANRIATGSEETQPRNDRDRIGRVKIMARERTVDFQVR